MLTQSKPHSKQKGRFWQRLSGHWSVWIALTAYLLLLVGLSWQRWLSPIADSGRELDLPRRLLEGETLYRDVHYLYGPLAPYLKALLYRLFGVHLSVLQMSGLIAAILVIVMIYAIARCLLEAWGAGLAAATVALFCAFKPGGNLVSPYSYAALFALVFSLGVLLAMISYMRRGRAGYLLIAGTLTGLTGVTKLEIALAAAITTVVGVFAFWWHDADAQNRKTRRLIERLLILSLPILLIALPVYGYFFHLVGWRTMIEDCHILYTHLPGPMLYYNARRSGLDRPWLSLLQLIGGGLVLVVVCGLFLTIANPHFVRRGARLGGLGLLAVVGVIVGIRLVVGSQWDGSPLRFMPVLLTLVIFGAWGKDPGRLVVAVYSLAVLARVALRVPSGGAFGSFFLPGALVILIWFLLRWLPAWAERVGMATEQRRLRSVIVVSIIALLSVTTVVYAVRYRRTYSYQIQTPRGTYYAPASAGPIIAQTIDYISSNTAVTDPVVVLPEGSDLTFLAGRHHPLRHQIMVPGLMSTTDEAEAIRTIARRQVGSILIVNRPMREFGLTGFGEDFYQRLGGWIVEYYEPVVTLGADGDPTVRIGDPRFFIRIYARRNSGAPNP